MVICVGLGIWNANWLGNILVQLELCILLNGIVTS